MELIPNIDSEYLKPVNPVISEKELEIMNNNNNNNNGIATGIKTDRIPFSNFKDIYKISVDDRLKAREEMERNLKNNQAELKQMKAEKEPIKNVEEKINEIYDIRNEIEKVKIKEWENFKYEYNMGKGLKAAPNMISRGKNRKFSLLISTKGESDKGGKRECKLLWYPIIKSSIGDLSKRKVKGEMLLEKVERDSKNSYKLTFFGVNSSNSKKFKRTVTFSESQMRNIIGSIVDNCDNVDSKGLKTFDVYPMAKKVEKGGRKTKKQKVGKRKTGKRKTGKKKTLNKKNKKKLRTRRR